MMDIPRGRYQKGMGRASVVFCLYGIFVCAALLVSGLRGQPNLYLVGSQSADFAFWQPPLIGVLVGLLFVVLSQWSTKRFEWAHALNKHFRDLLGPMSDREILVIAAASAIGEEFLFRGMLMPITGIWIQALLFALLHIGPSKKFLPWTFSSFVMGLLFGAISLWCGNLGAAIAAHFVINFLNLHFIARKDISPAWHRSALS